MSIQLNDKGLRADINVTPLVDVMLVLLIIFMVITPMLQRGKAVQLPQVPRPEKQSDNGKDIVLSLEYLGSPTRYNLYLGRARIEESSLRGRLEDERRRDPAREVYLKGDARLTYGTIRKVMEVCHEAGFPQVRLATDESKGS
jgi:biopolymer transport protein TolR